MKNRSGQFTADLDYGKAGENELWPWIERYFSTSTRLVSYWYDSDYEARNLKGTSYKSKLKEYDLKFGVYKESKIFCERELTFEIKTDKYERNTGNLVFEYKDKGYESGPFGSSADYFIYWLPKFTADNLYIIKTDKLIELLKREEYKNYLTYGGDVDKTQMFVIPKTDFNNDFIKAGGKIETLNSERLLNDFGISQFKVDNKKTNYYSDEIKKYDDPFLF
jgi:hypothetical protein